MPERIVPRILDPAIIKYTPSDYCMAYWKGIQQVREYLLSKLQAGDFKSAAEYAFANTKNYIYLLTCIFLRDLLGVDFGIVPVREPEPPVTKIRF